MARAGPRAADIRSARAQHLEGGAMMPWWVLAVFVLGANFALWGSVGLIRLGESVAGRRRVGRARVTGLASTSLPSTGLPMTDLAGPGLAARGLASTGRASGGGGGRPVDAP